MGLDSTGTKMERAADGHGTGRLRQHSPLPTSSIRPAQQSSWSILLSPTTRSYAEGRALGIPLPVNWILGETGEIGESCYLTLVGLLWRLCVWGTQQGLIINTFLEIGYKKPKDQKVDVHRRNKPEGGLSGEASREEAGTWTDHLCRVILPNSSRVSLLI